MLVKGSLVIAPHIEAVATFGISEAGAKPFVGMAMAVKRQCEYTLKLLDDSKASPGLREFCTHASIAVLP